MAFVRFILRHKRSGVIGLLLTVFACLGWCVEFSSNGLELIEWLHAKPSGPPAPTAVEKTTPANSPAAVPSPKQFEQVGPDIGQFPTSVTVLCVRASDGTIITAQTNDPSRRLAIQHGPTQIQLFSSAEEAYPSKVEDSAPELESCGFQETPPRPPLIRGQEDFPPEETKAVPRVLDRATSASAQQIQLVRATDLSIQLKGVFRCAKVFWYPEQRYLGIWFHGHMFQLGEGNRMVFADGTYWDCEDTLCVRDGYVQVPAPVASAVLQHARKCISAPPGRYR